MDTPTVVAAFAPMEDDLARSGLVPSDMDARPYPGSGFTPDVGYSIPYYYPSGIMHPLMRRWRFTDPAIAKQQRYGQPSTADIIAGGYSGTDATYPYFNPLILGGLTWEKLAATPGPVTWTIVEGEKKAVCAGKYLKKPFIGIGGCNNALVNTAMPWRELHPALRGLFRQGDGVEVVLDGDITTNENVNYAAGTLRRVLLSCGIAPRFVLLPNGMGLDDWLMSLPEPARQAQYATLPRVTGEGWKEHPHTLAKALGLRFDEKMNPKVDEENVTRLLRRHERYAGKVWFDCIKNRLMETVIEKAPRPLTDDMAFNEGVWMQSVFKVRPNMVQATILALPGHQEFRRNPVKEWLDKLVWDMTPRIDKMLVKGWGVEDSPYHDAVSKNILTSMIARAVRPGCQVDTMFIFEGPQGIFKSKALEVLGGDWYLGVSDKMDSKDFKLTCHTGWLVDVIELGGFKYADYVMVKGMITGRTDSFRPPYGRSTSDYPRHFVLFGTTNDDAYLRDTTGNRRFVPIDCSHGKISIEWITANRIQLFAEAYAAFLSGYEWWTEPPGIMGAQALRMTYDPWDAHIDAILVDEMRNPVVGKRKPMHFVPAVNILTMLGVPRAQQNTGHFARLRELMRLREPGWERFQYIDESTPVAVSDGMGGSTMVTACRGYRKFFTGTPPSANIIDIRNSQGGSKF